MQKKNNFLVPLVLGLAVVLPDVAAAATTSSRVTSRCTRDSRGVHECPSGAPEESNGLDPRAETYYLKKIPVREDFFEYEFQANYFVTSVKRTTIAQLLNENLSVSDKYKPVLFIVAWKKSNGKLKVCMFESCRHVWDDVPIGFRLRLNASGKLAQVSIDGRACVMFNLISPLNGANRPRGSQQMRWGVYHHDIANGSAASTAQVRVYDIASKGF